VFETAAQQATTWRRRFESWLFPVSVNLGPGELSDALVERFGRLRAEHALPAGALALDISEPELLSDVSANRPRISALKEAGAQILVDDFGTTHALGAGPGAAVERSTDELMLSLVALEEFRIDVVKVDRELIDRCFAGPRDAQVIEGVVKLVHLFGCRVLAEGVESGDEAERLRRGGFDLAQGYYFQPPHGPGHIDRLLHDLADARRAFASPGAAAP
jgi:EAL domain-containing protein (putative c-di-GMP-specific phosphodiesterase class I)